MIIKGCASADQLQKIAIFHDLDPSQIQNLLTFSAVREYLAGEILMHEGDRLPQQLYALIEGLLEIKKTSINGKETLLRLVTAGEVFAAPAIFGDGMAPATIVCRVPAQVLTLKREALLQAISQSPEISLKILELFNQRLQQLQNTVHGLTSERAIVRLIKLLQYYQERDGTCPVAEGDQLNIQLPYDQLARSIGISYEECVRLFKHLKGVVSYQRGGKIIIQDQQKFLNL